MFWFCSCVCVLLTCGDVFDVRSSSRREVPFSFFLLLDLGLRSVKNKYASPAASCIDFAIPATVMASDGTVITRWRHSLSRSHSPFLSLSLSVRIVIIIKNFRLSKHTKLGLRLFKNASKLQIKQQISSTIFEFEFKCDNELAELSEKRVERRYG